MSTVYSDPAADFAEAMQRAGVPPPEHVTADGQLHRFRVEGDKNGSRNGWYIFHMDGLPAGAFGNWKTGIEATWCTKRDSELTREERVAHRRRMEQAKAEREREVERRQAEAREQAATRWERAGPPDGHPYLERKAVQAHGIRQDGGELLIPMRDTAGTLHSLQRIRPDGDKRFMAGGRVTGCYHAIGRPGQRVLIAEGYSTAASLHHATSEAVACAFNAGNLKAVAQALRAKHPDMEIIVCADDDDAGRNHAHEAAEAAKGRVVLPDFGDDRPEGVTDFNDLAALEGMEAVRAQLAEPEEVRPSPFDAERARVRADIFEKEPPAPRFVVERYLPVDVAALVAPGGTGKTTLVQYEGVHIALGIPLYGLAVERPGPVVFVTGEDEKEDFEHRLYHLVGAMDLTADQRSTLRNNIYVEDVSGRLSRIVEMDRAGNLIFTDLVDSIIDAYRDIRPALINFDPLVSFGPGERIVNDGEQAVVVALRRIVKALGCCCRVVHHTGQAVHRERIVDLYSGRGGSSLGDGVRSQAQLVLHTTGDKLQRPPGILHEDIEQERVLRLHINKVSRAQKPTDPMWLVRTGWTFDHHAASTEDAEAGRRRQEREDTEVVLSYLRRRLSETPPIRHTRRSLEDAYGDVGIPRNRVRTIVDMAIQRGELAESELPREEQHGRRTHYLRPQS